MVQIIKKEIPLSNQTGTGLMPYTGHQTISLQERSLLNNAMASLYLSRRTISASRVKAGEKLLYAFFFKTSQFNNVREKLSSYYHLNTISSQPSGYYQYQEAKYNGPEPFDYYDLKQHSVTNSGITYNIGPLIKITALERTSNWHNSFANPFVYDQIEWMRSKGYWSGDVLFEKASLGLTSTKLVEIENSVTTPDLTDITQMINNELSSGRGNIFQSLQGFSNTLINQPALQQSVPPLIIKYNHGLIVPSDFDKLKNKSFILLYNPFSGVNSSDKPRLNQIYSRTYQMMSKGNYPLKFYYNYRGCLGPDNSAQTYSKWFIY